MTDAVNWTPELTQAALSMRAAGVVSRTIAEMLGINVNAVFRKLASAQGAPKFQRWSADDDAALIGLRAKTPALLESKIASELGRSVFAVRARVKLLNLPPQRREYAQSVALPRSAVPFTPAAWGHSVPEAMAAEERATVRALPAAPIPDVTLMPMGRCCYPLWGDHERPTHHYCDAPRTGSRSYCADHAVKCNRFVEWSEKP